MSFPDEWNKPPMTTAEYREAAAKATKENAFQAQVIRFARELGWLVHHCRPVVTQSGRAMTPIQGDAGFPDLVMTLHDREDESRDRCIVAELKSFRGRRDFQHGQQEWLTAWRAIEQRTKGAVRAFVWTPMDWDDIERELKEGTR